MFLLVSATSKAFWFAYSLPTSYPLRGSMSCICFSDLPMIEGEAVGECQPFARFFGSDLSSSNMLPLKKNFVRLGALAGFSRNYLGVHWCASAHWYIRFPGHGLDTEQSAPLILKHCARRGSDTATGFMIGCVSGTLWGLLDVYGRLMRRGLTKGWERAKGMARSTRNECCRSHAGEGRGDPLLSVCVGLGAVSLAPFGAIGQLGLCFWLGSEGSGHDASDSSGPRSCGNLAERYPDVRCFFRNHLV